MTETINAPAATSGKPPYIAYHVQESSGGTSFWNPVGAAWPHADGRGLSLQLKSIPFGGRITLRIPSEKTK